MKSTTIKSQAGMIRITASAKGISQIDFLEEGDCEVVEGEETDDPILLQAIAELEEYFAGRRQTFDVPIDLQIGTPFQKEAWDMLCRIPYGQTLSYGQQAKAMGRPNAQRAVGGANGKNPLPVIIPCHRVVNSLGKLHGFSGGVELKRYLLSVEGLTLEK